MAKRSGYPGRSRTFRNVRSEADLLQANRWPLRRRDIRDHGEAVTAACQWEKLPSSIFEGEKLVKFSKEPRLMGDWVFDVSMNRSALYCFELPPRTPQSASREQLWNPVKIVCKGLIVSYDVDWEEQVLMILKNGEEATQLLTYQYSLPDFLLVKEETLCGNVNSVDYAEVSVNGSHVMVSLGQDVTVYNWKTIAQSQVLWSRKRQDTSRCDDEIFRAELLSSQIVACTVLDLDRSCRYAQMYKGRIELYRLDRPYAVEAVLALPAMIVDIWPQPRQKDANRYIALNVGGKMAVDRLLQAGQDELFIIQLFHKTRMGSLLSLLYLLYSGDSLSCALPTIGLSRPTTSQHLKLDEEWIKKEFKFCKSLRIHSAGICGPRMISVAMKNLWGSNCECDFRLMYSSSTLQSSSASHVLSFEDIEPLLSGPRERRLYALRTLRPHLSDVISTKEFPVASISLDGPRALFTRYSLNVDAEGVVGDSEPTGSYISTFELENTDSRLLESSTS